MISASGLISEEQTPAEKAYLSSASLCCWGLFSFHLNVILFFFFSFLFFCIYCFIFVWLIYEKDLCVAVFSWSIVLFRILSCNHYLVECLDCQTNSGFGVKTRGDDKRLHTIVAILLFGNQNFSLCISQIRNGILTRVLILSFRLSWFGKIIFICFGEVFSSWNGTYSTLVCAVRLGVLIRFKLGSGLG